MLYKVRAKFQEEKLAAFFRALTDGTIAAQKPDGTTIVKAMQEAKITSPKTIEWYEHCHCATPLAHEQTTVYNTYMTDFETQEVSKVEDDIKGDSFWHYMQQHA